MRIVRSFLWLLLLFSAPLWLAATLLDATEIIPVALPFSALQFLSVLLAAIVVTRHNGGSMRALLRRGIDVQRIDNPLWRVGIIVIMPLTVGLSYLMLLASGANVSDQMTPLLSIPVFLLVYGISAYCEEIGWTAIMTDRLLERHTVIMSGLLVGVAWALWHVVPYIQTHNSASWIFWQCIFTIIARLLFTKVYLLTNRSVFSTVVIHATYNSSFSMMPYYGSSYNPMTMTIATLFITIIAYALSNLPRHEQAIH